MTNKTHVFRGKNIFTSTKYQQSASEMMLYLQLKSLDCPLPKMEYRFHPTRRWRFDFAWPVQKIAIEVQGGTWSKGRHVRGTGYENDCEKLNEAQRLGWKVYQFTTNMITDGCAFRFMKDILVGI